MPPPKIEAFPAIFVPNFLPIISPEKQMPKVTKAIIKAETKAIKKPYSEIVQPTESASIDVAIPCTIKAPKPSPDFSASDS